MDAHGALGRERNREPLADVDLFQTEDSSATGCLRGSQLGGCSEPEALPRVKGKYRPQ